MDVRYGTYLEEDIDNTRTTHGSSFQKGKPGLHEEHERPHDDEEELSHNSGRSNIAKRRKGKQKENAKWGRRLEYTRRIIVSW